MKTQTKHTQRNVIMTIAFIVLTISISFSNPIEAIANSVNFINNHNYSSQLSSSLNRDTVASKGISYYRVNQTNFSVGASIIIKGSKVELKNIEIYNAKGEEVTMLTKVIKSSEGSVVIDLSKLRTIKTNTITSVFYKS